MLSTLKIPYIKETYSSIHTCIAFRNTIMKTETTTDTNTLMTTKNTKETKTINKPKPVKELNTANKTRTKSPKEIKAVKVSNTDKAETNGNMETRSTTTLKPWQQKAIDNGRTPLPEFPGDKPGA